MGTTRPGIKAVASPTPGGCSGRPGRPVEVGGMWAMMKKTLIAASSIWNRSVGYEFLY